jgi:diguanylate cyclase (GGDEF)-like protein/PAS domain S-box-containing protein
MDTTPMTPLTPAPNTALNLALDHVSDGVFTAVPVAGGRWRLASANRALARLLRRDLTGHLLCEVLPRAHWRRLRLQLRELQRTLHPVEFDVTADVDGTRMHHLRVRLMPVTEAATITEVVGIVRVQTETIRIRREYMGLRDRFASVFEYAPYGVCFVGTNTRPVMINRAFQKFFDRPLKQLTADSVVGLVHPDDQLVFAKALDKVLDGSRSYDGMEIRLAAKSDVGVWVSVSMSLARDYAAGQPYAIMQTVDISARKASEAELMRLATQDHLTGLYNRMVFDQNFRVALANAKRYKRQGAVLFIDMDDFKSVNDTFGHKAGDAALKAVADVLRKTMRETDTVARIGGDEFAVILEEVDIRQAGYKVERIRSALEGLTVTAHGKTVQVNASVGVRVFDGRVDSCVPDDILNAADKDMYARKEAQKAQRVAS